MAIKLSKDGKITKLKPNSKKYFDIEEIEEIVGGWPYPLKFGPIWVIQNENLLLELDEINNLATRFFRSLIYGDILVLSSHELPTEWDLIEESDMRYTTDEIDAGFLASIINMIAFENMYPQLSDSHQYHFSNNTNNNLSLIEYSYVPDKNDELDENAKNFLRNAYEHVISSSSDFKNFVIYKDNSNIVRVISKKDQLKTLEQMLKIFVEDEEYEKAAKLRDLKNLIEKSV